MTSNSLFKVEGHTGIVRYPDGSWDNIFVSGDMESINKDIIDWYTNNKPLIVKIVELRTTYGVYLGNAVELDVAIKESIGLNITSTKVPVLGYKAYNEIFDYRITRLH
jgi:hypothetical protein